MKKHGNLDQYIRWTGEYLNRVPPEKSLEYYRYSNLPGNLSCYEAYKRQNSATFAQLHRLFRGLFDGVLSSSECMTTGD